MDRGHYAVSVGDRWCPHRHYELSAALLRCWRESGPAAVVRYVWPDGSMRLATDDELSELRTHGQA